LYVIRNFNGDDFPSRIITTDWFFRILVCIIRSKIALNLLRLFVKIINFSYYFLTHIILIYSLTVEFHFALSNFCFLISKNTFLAIISGCSSLITINHHTKVYKFWISFQFAWISSCNYIRMLCPQLQNSYCAALLAIFNWWQPKKIKEFYSVTIFFSFTTNDVL
jgi:hypothetical protein